MANVQYHQLLVACSRTRRKCSKVQLNIHINDLRTFHVHFCNLVTVPIWLEQIKTIKPAQCIKMITLKITLIEFAALMTFFTSNFAEQFEAITRLNPGIRVIFLM